jgi:ZIP family zinc transporter
VLEAAFWGLLTSGSLLVGAGLAVAFRPGRRAVGLTMAFGAGALISAVAYDLVLEAFAERALLPTLGLVTGALTFFVGDALIDRMGGHGRKSMEGEHQAAAGAAPGIVLGTVLDGLPESAILGATLVEGGSISYAFIVAVFVSNLPESISSTAGLREAGWRLRRIFSLWALVVAASTATAVLGWLAFDNIEGLDSSFLLAFAAGGVLVMLADTMMPEAFLLGGRTAGLATTLGFALAFAVVQLE